MGVKKSDPPEEEAENKKRKNRKGTRGKGHRITYNKDQDPSNDKLDVDKNDSRISAHRGGAEGLRDQNHQEKRTTPPETPRPKTHLHQ